MKANGIQQAMKKYGPFVLPAALLALTVAGCHGNQSSGAAAAQPASSDPAAVNLAPASDVTTNTENPPPPPPDTSAPPPASEPVSDTYPATQAPDGYGDPSGDYEDTADFIAPEPPPPLPDYDQPPCPDDDYEWTPGYWAYAPEGYYWVPGEWVLAPWVGALWTPGYWGFYENRYHWYHGYWGPHVGFYGGVNYGYGYGGDGYEGGYWRSNHFYYNRTITHVNVNVRNVYNYRVTIHNDSRVSYNGGNGGLHYRPTQAQMAARNERHVAALPSQRETARNAQRNPQQFDRTNHGRPQNMAETQPMNDGRRAPAARPQDFHPANLPQGTSRGAAGHTGPAPVTNMGRPNGHPVYNNRPAPQERTMPQQRPEGNPQGGQRPGQEGRTVTRPTREPEQRRYQEPQTTNNPHPTQHVGARPRPEVPPRPQPNPQGAPHPQENGAPQGYRGAPGRENRPAQPENRPAPQPRPEERPAPQPHAEQPRQGPPQQEQQHSQQPHPEQQRPQQPHSDNRPGDRNPH